MADRRAHRLVEPFFDRLRCDAIEFAESIPEMTAAIRDELTTDRAIESES